MTAQEELISRKMELSKGQNQLIIEKMKNRLDKKSKFIFFILKMTRNNKR